MSTAAPWWKSAVVYQIYPRSFADSNGDGIGDLRGIVERLDHLVWLGVDAIWLSPFFPSPMADFGYDVSDYCDVDPLFGSLDDFDALLAGAHERGLRVVLDWVPNHTSDQHPWFQAARSSVDDPKRDWYVWRPQTPEGAPPNNWVTSWSEENAPAWTIDPVTDEWFLHLFLPQQPDLNWRNPEVVAAMHDVLRFWLDRGVDGFRMDVVHLIGKDEALADDPEEFLPLPHVVLNHHPEELHLIEGIRQVLDEYDDERMMVGEIALLDPKMVADYYVDGRGMQLAFNFAPLFAPWDAGFWELNIDAVAESIEPKGWPAWVLGNHDNPRQGTRYLSEDRTRTAAFLLLGLRGTPFLYAGEELGLEDAVVPPDQVVDPGGRDGCRAPIPWDSSDGHGWGPEPWLPWPPDLDQRNVATQTADPGSIASLYRRLLSERRATTALQVGDQSMLESPAGVLAWDRTDGGERRRLVANLGPDEADVASLVDGWRVLLDSADPAATDASASVPSTLPADRALLLGPA
jgi:alpha-glucosidase